MTKMVWSQSGHINRRLLYCKYGVLVFGDDGTGLVDESKRTKRVQGWSRQIMGEGLLILAILSLCEITTSFV